MRRIVIVLFTSLLVLVGCGNDGEAEPVGRETPTVRPTVHPTVHPASTPAVTPVPSRAEARRLGLAAVAALKDDDPQRALALIRRGADVNVRDGILDSVFLYAGAEGYTAVVRAALARGADTRVLNRYGGTALIPAAEHAHLGVIRLLLNESDVEVDHVNDLGWTALGEAVGLGDGGPRALEAVRLLLAAGADPTVRDRFGRTVLENAERLGHAAIAAEIRAAG